MRKLILLLLFAASSSYGQPAFDDARAKSLGADQYGMKNYILVILKTGDKEISDTKERNDIFAGHMKNIQKMAAEGKLAVAGPFGTNSSNYRGLYIFNVTTIDEAKALTETDPAVRSGMMKAEFYPWYGSAAMMEVNKIHDTIAKSKF